MPMASSHEKFSPKPGPTGSTIRAVHFDFESKHEMIRVPREKAKQVHMPGLEQPEQLDLPEYEEIWTGDYIFENEWQSFRTKKDSSLD